MPQHKFKVGQRVTFFPLLRAQASLQGTYEIVRLLPPEGSGFQYRIKELIKGQERVVTEGEIG
jgi:hypothetical protein